MLLRVSGPWDVNSDGVATDPLKVFYQFTLASVGQGVNALTGIWVPFVGWEVLAGG